MIRRWRGAERRAAELDEEIDSHFRMAVEERVARGETRADATLAARMELTAVNEDGVTVVEGQSGAAFMSSAEDAALLLEACFSNSVRAALLYADNLPAAFFDLSSGQAGAILQKLRNYGVRLAVVSSPGGTQFSSRFGEMLAEERQGRYFGLFETRRAAREWLASTD
jgi:hypothetical protein